jgi:hypothetical protein
MCCYCDGRSSTASTGGGPVTPDVAQSAAVIVSKNLAAERPIHHGIRLDPMAARAGD